MLTRALVSRALLHRALKNTADNLKQAKRNSSHGVWAYRTPPPLPSKKAIMIAEFFGTFAWWWVFWHIFTEPGHVVGEWPSVNPSHWTDEELGIPGLEKGPLARVDPNDFKEKECEDLRS